MASISSILNPGEIRLFETFSTYKIFTLELIATYCNIKVTNYLNMLKATVKISFLLILLKLYNF
jgi:hypothetical protein